MDFEVRSFKGEDIPSSLKDEWERCLKAKGSFHLEQYPDWLVSKALPGTTKGNACVVSLYDEEDCLVALAPLFLRAWKWHCRLGYTSIFRFPVHLADLYGDTLIGRDDRETQESLLAGITDSCKNLQMLFLEGVPIDSSLWKTLQESRAVHERFWVYRPAGITRRYRLRLPRSFADYLQQFSRDSRYKLRRCVRKLSEAGEGELRLLRFTDRCRLDEFLLHAESLSLLSWQGKKLGQIVKPDDERERLGALADCGWLRCYLLMKGSIPLAFQIGYQFEGRYYLDRTGYDPDWAVYRPGSVLLYQCLEDLFAYQTPAIMDFGYGEHEYKRFFGNEQYDEATVYLIRKSAYMGLACLAHRACSLATTSTRTLLDRVKMREKVRRFLRGATIDAPPPTERTLAPAESLVTT